MSNSRDWTIARELTEQPRLDIRVSHEMLHRALRIMDAIVRALEVRGYSLEVSDENSRSTYAVIKGERVQIHLWEKDNRSERELTEDENSRRSGYVSDRWVFTPSGKLTFTIDEYWEECRRKNWTDRLHRALEEQLNDVMVGMITAAGALRLRKLKWQEEERLRREDALRREQAERRRRDEEERRKLLENMFESWTRSQSLLAFIHVCEVTLGLAAPIPQDGPEANWLRWARGHANQLDPLKTGSLRNLIDRGLGDQAIK